MDFHPAGRHLPPPQAGVVLGDDRSLSGSEESHPARVGLRLILLYRPAMDALQLLEDVRRQFPIVPGGSIAPLPEPPRNAFLNAPDARHGIAQLCFRFE